jgi:hypothetical protein
MVGGGGGGTGIECSPAPKPLILITSFIIELSSAKGVTENELIYRCQKLCTLSLQWVDWFNNRHPLETIENIPPAEAEANFYAALKGSDMAA